MPIELKCPNCGHQLRISSKYAGKRGVCKHCKGTVDVPEAPAPEQASIRGEAFAPDDATAGKEVFVSDNEEGLSGLAAMGMSAEDAKALETLNIDDNWQPPPPAAASGGGIDGEKPLGVLFWLVLVIFTPAALIWAIVLPSGHSQKRMAIIASVLVLFVAPVLLIGTLIALPLAILYIAGDTIGEGSESSGTPAEVATEAAALAPSTQQSFGNAPQITERVIIDEPGLMIVVYDLGGSTTYDMRGIELYVKAALDAFPVQSNPGIRPVADAYEAARRSPTFENGQVLERAFSDFGDNLRGEDERRMQEVIMNAMSIGMARMQADVLNGLVVQLRTAFSTRDYPALSELYDAAEAFSSDTSEAAAERAQAALENFMNGLSLGDRDWVESTMQENAQSISDTFSGATTQTMITAWVDQIEQSHEYIRGDKGDYVADTAFEQIEGEMHYGQVLSIIGQEGDRQMRSNSNIDGVRTTSAVYMWSWDIEPGVIARIHAFFLNDELRVKAYDEISD